MYQKIMSLTPKEVIILNGLLPVANEANQLSLLINRTYHFNIGEEKIVLKIDENRKPIEWITHDGNWIYGHNFHDGTYVKEMELQCTPEGIFSILKDEFLRSNHFDVDKTTMEWDKIQRFRDFINRTKKLYKNEKRRKKYSIIKIEKCLTFVDLLW